jgi:hypothetical protein
VPAQRPGEVGHEHHRALEHADQQQAALGVGVVRRDLLGQLADPSRICSSEMITRSMSASYQEPSAMA